MEINADDTTCAGYFAGSAHIHGGLLRRLAARIAAFGDREELSSNMPFTGEVLGIDPANLNRVLKGRREPSQVMLAKLQAFLAEESYPFAFSINVFSSSIEVTVALRLWTMAWQLAHRGTRSVSGSTSPSYTQTRA
jgi:hypothetical protein